MRIEIEKPLEVERKVAHHDAECNADATTIARETERTKPDGVFRADFRKKVDEHSARYPGGMLPYDMRVMFLCYVVDECVRCLGRLELSLPASTGTRA